MLDRALEQRDSSLDRIPDDKLKQFLAENRYRRLEELLADIALGNRMLNATLMSAKQPPLGKRGNVVDA